MSSRLSDVYWPLRLAYGLVPLLAGLDKFTNILADWGRYMSPAVATMLPVSVTTFLHVIGIVEIIVGLVILFGWTRIGALVAMVWLLAIALNLLLAGYFDIAVRDVVMAIAAYALSRVAAERGEELVPDFAHSGTHRLAHG